VTFAENNLVIIQRQAIQVGQGADVANPVAREIQSSQAGAIF
jgi:ribosomal protein L14